MAAQMQPPPPGGALMPYQAPPPPLGGQPIVNQPGQIIPPNALVPQYVGAGAAGDYMYANPMMGPYNMNDFTTYNPYRNIRRRNIMRRRMAAEGMMMMEAERMRNMEMAELGLGYGGMGYMGTGMGMGMGMGPMGMGPMGMGPMGMRGHLGFMDDTFLMCSGGRYLGPCGYPHRRGIPCPDCIGPDPYMY